MSSILAGIVSNDIPLSHTWYYFAVFVIIFFEQILGTVEAGPDSLSQVITFFKSSHREKHGKLTTFVAIVLIASAGIVTWRQMMNTERDKITIQDLKAENRALKIKLCTPEPIAPPPAPTPVALEQQLQEKIRELSLSQSELSAARTELHTMHIDQTEHARVLRHLQGLLSAADRERQDLRSEIEALKIRLANPQPKPETGGVPSERVLTFGVRVANIPCILSFTPTRLRLRCPSEQHSVDLARNTPRINPKGAITANDGKSLEVEFYPYTKGAPKASSLLPAWNRGEADQSINEWHEKIYQQHR